MIYQATSPSGEAYIGLTGTSLKRRWQRHTQRARGGSRKHPLVAAIRKHGPGTFTLEILERGLSLQEARVREQHWISARGTLAPNGYNISAGGEHDAGAEGAAFRDRLSDPVWRAAYLERLSDGCKRRPVRLDLPLAAARWRKENPRAAWRNIWRGIRVSLRGRRRGGDPRFGAWGRLWIPGKRVASARRSYFARSIVAGVWAERAPAKKADVGARIAESLSSYHEANRAKTHAMLAETRSKIDRSVQSRRASAGLKKWWSDLKADPERYAAHFAAKAAKRRAR